MMEFSIHQGSYDVSTITIAYALSTAHEGDSILLFDITNPAFVHRLTITVAQP